MNNKNEKACCFKTSVGGQALMEGVMMRGPQKMCVAVRQPDGEIFTEVSPIRTHPWQKWPFVRGIFNFIDSLVSGYKCLMKSAEVSMGEDADLEETKFDKWVAEKFGDKGTNFIMAVAAVLGGVLALVLFMVVPTALAGLLARFVPLGVATHVPGARVTAVELSPDALAYLRANNAACGCPLCVVQADVLRWQEECAPGSFDVIVSNPPYIAPEEMAGLQPELFHEPRMALEAPDGGLAFYKHIAPAYFGALKPGGRLILEIGWRQADAVCALCLSAGYEDVSVRSDLSGNPRCVLARRPIAF